MFYRGLRKRTSIPVPSNLLLTLNFLSLVTRRVGSFLCYLNIFISLFELILA